MTPQENTQFLVALGLLIQDVPPHVLGMALAHFKSFDELRRAYQHISHMHALTKINYDRTFHQTFPGAYLNTSE